MQLYDLRGHASHSTRPGAVWLEEEDLGQTVGRIQGGERKGSHPESTDGLILPYTGVANWPIAGGRATEVLALAAADSHAGATVASRTGVCPQCGALVGGGDRRCLRCGRSIPPEWYRACERAFVGVFGSESPATYLLLALCALDFVLMQGPLVLRNPADTSWILHGQVGFVSLMQYGGLIYLPIPGADGRLIEHLTLVEPWRLVSAIFVHVSALHVVMNGWSLLSLGRAMETRLGSGRFTVVFFVCGVVGYLSSELYYWLLPGASGTAGASGSLFGLIGSWGGYLYARRDPGYKEMLARVAVMAIAFAIVFPVNNAAHVGGLIAGFPLGILYYREARPWQRDGLFRMAGVGLVMLGIVSVILCMTSPIARSAARQVERAQVSSIDHAETAGLR